ncbi:hypothetical protein O3P69_015168 [Scylla paramamosain]|uniref:Uncharacterized protein n=1 Tax=Scylla paramamosain TaxID=85552 RepID=A0AAW0T3M9_SCYPA
MTTCLSLRSTHTQYVGKVSATQGSHRMGKETSVASPDQIFSYQNNTATDLRGVRGWLLLAVVVVMEVQVDVAKAAALPIIFPSHVAIAHGKAARQRAPSPAIPPLHVAVPPVEFDLAVRCILCPTCDEPCHMRNLRGECRPIYNCKRRL